MIYLISLEAAHNHSFSWKLEESVVDRVARIDLEVKQNNNSASICLYFVCKKVVRKATCS